MYNKLTDILGLYKCLILEKSWVLGVIGVEYKIIQQSNTRLWKTVTSVKPIDKIAFLTNSEKTKVSKVPWDKYFSNKSIT